MEPDRGRNRRSEGQGFPRSGGCATDKVHVFALPEVASGVAGS